MRKGRGDVMRKGRGDVMQKVGGHYRDVQQDHRLERLEGFDKKEGGELMRLMGRIVSQNRVVIPKRIREVSNIQEGDLVEVKVTCGEKTAYETLRVSERGQIYLPEVLREALDAEEGDIVLVTIENVIKSRER